MKNDFTKQVNWLLKEKYSGKQTKSFFADVKKIKAGEPVDYVIGFIEFLGCKIDLSYKPLIPRPETEFWAQKAIDDIKSIMRQITCNSCDSKKNKIKILDMFSGSGCIGLAILKNIKCCNVTFADNDKNAILQIKKNIKINFGEKHSDILRNVRVLKSDLFGKLGKKKFNIILANPPYIPTKNKNKVQKSTLKYEPKKALFGGGDGLFYIRKFLEQAPAFVETSARRGKIYMEFDPPQKKQIEKLLKSLNYKTWEFYKDQFGKWRWVEII